MPGPLHAVRLPGGNWLRSTSDVHLDVADLAVAVAAPQRRPGRARRCATSRRCPSVRWRRSLRDCAVG
eukprot:5086392-Alexandrium_andersonii.AAC.1